MKIIKICPDCNTDEYLCWAWEQDGTTDCMSCGSNFEEHELKERETSDIKNKTNRREDR